jgi:hypothetical protein
VAKAPIAAATQPAPAAVPEPERYRQLRLTARLRQLLECLREAATLRGLGQPLLQGAVVGLVVGAVVGYVLGGALFEVLRRYANVRQGMAEDVGGLVGVLIGLGACGAILWLRWRFWRKARQEAEQALVAKIEEVLQEFPQECQVWGGVTALRDLDIMKAVVGDPGQNSDHYRKVRLVTRLRQVLDCLGAVAYNRPSFYPIGQGAFLGLIVGSGLGYLLGALLADFLWHYAIVARGIAEDVGILVGVLIGLGTCGALFWGRLLLWRKARLEADKDLAARIDQVLEEFPQESQQWGGRGALREREIVQELLRDLKGPRP